MSEAIDPRFCPDCGAGSLGGGLFQLPRGFPLDKPCETCKLRGEQHWREVGERWAYERERRIIDSMFDPIIDEQGRVS